MTLRPYQSELVAGIYQAWQNGARDVCAVMPTGAGKTRTFSHIINESREPAVAIAHRQQLVSQMSLTLAENGVVHRVIGPNNLIKTIVSLHMRKFGRSFYDPSARHAVAGVDTLIRRTAKLGKWLPTVGLVVTDEAHHLLRENKWGKAVEMFPNAKGLGVTATPLRADGRGLGRHSDGVFDRLVEGPSMRWLIDNGYLTDYKIFAPPSDIVGANIPMSKTTGDFNEKALRDITAKSSIVVPSEKAVHVGDVVKHYLRIAPGKLGITFVPSIKIAEEIRDQFVESGVPAAVVSADTPDIERFEILERFERRELLQLINVDLFGEGFDLPAIEVVSMARPTASYGLYVQQFGRALRLMDGKTHAIIIDHVGNVMRHGLPDAPRQWSLDAREKRGSNGPGDAMALRTCPECTGVYPRIATVCEHCGAPAPEPVARNAPEFVDGDLHELNPETLAKMRAAVAEMDRPVEEVVESERLRGIAAHMPEIGIKRLMNLAAKKQSARQESLAVLREIMAQWAGYHRAVGRSDSEIFKRFYLKYQVDWLTAMTLEPDQMNDLAGRVAIDIGDV